MHPEEDALSVGGGGAVGGDILGNNLKHFCSWWRVVLLERGVDTPAPRRNAFILANPVRIWLAQNRSIP